jgi:hypothetical protein
MVRLRAALGCGCAVLPIFAWNRGTVTVLITALRGESVAHRQLQAPITSAFGACSFSLTLQVHGQEREVCDDGVRRPRLWIVSFETGDSPQVRTFVDIFADAEALIDWSSSGAFGNFLVGVSTVGRAAVLQRDPARIPPDGNGELRN